jgi:hypothetical protein
MGAHVDEEHSSNDEQPGGTGARRWAVPAVVALCVVLAATLGIAALGGGDEKAAPSTTRPTVATTTTVSTTTVPATTTPEQAETTTTTTTAPPPPPVTAAPAAVVPDLPPNGGRWDGSGCDPGSDTLPDGWWAGQIGLYGGTSNAVTAIGFDLACVKRHPVVEDGYFWAEVQNSSVTERVLAVDPNLELATRCISGDLGLQFDVNGLGVQPCGLHRVAIARDSDTVWLKVINGTVHQVIQQFEGFDAESP